LHTTRLALPEYGDELLRLTLGGLWRENTQECGVPQLPQAIKQMQKFVAHTVQQGRATNQMRPYVEYI